MILHILTNCFPVKIHNSSQKVCRRLNTAISPKECVCVFRWGGSVVGGDSGKSYKEHISQHAPPQKNRKFCLKKRGKYRALTSYGIGNLNFKINTSNKNNYTEQMDIVWFLFSGGGTKPYLQHRAWGSCKLGQDPFRRPKVSERLAHIGPWKQCTG